MYVCVMYVRTYVCIIYVNIYAYMYVCMYVCVYVGMNACTYACMYLYMYPRTVYIYSTCRNTVISPMCWTPRLSNCCEQIKHKICLAVKADNVM